MSAIPPVPKSEPSISHPHSLNMKTTTAYGSGNPDPGIGQTHQCGGAKAINGSLTAPHDNCIFNGDTYITNDKDTQIEAV